MINLIPPEGKKNVKLEYWTRVVSVWLFLLSAALLTGTALMVPLFVLTNGQLEAIANEQRKSVETEEQHEEAQRLIREANEIGKKLVDNSTNVPLTKIVESIDTETTKDIAIKNISINYDDEKNVKIQVQGIAATRASLATFKNDLEAAPLFSFATIPISDLARDTDLPFAVTIELSSIVN